MDEPSMRQAQILRTKVTVYVPCRQYAHYLDECLRSLARQTLRDWEAILIDDASTDGSFDLMEAFRARFPDRVRVLRNAQPQGLRANANAALELARG